MTALAIISVFVNAPLSGAAFFIFMLCIVYLDESGDLGWTLSKPYRNGGSSRFLTLAYLIIPENLKHIPTRLVKDVYKKFNFEFSEECKGHSFTQEQKQFVSSEVVKMLNKNPLLKLGAITVRKENVMEHIRKDPNKLYNYMMKLSILKKILNFEKVKIIGDERNIKVSQGKRCVDYLQMSLYFDYESTTIIEDIQQASHKNQNLIFIDWISNIVWSKYENNTSSPFDVLKPYLANETLYM